MPLVKNYCHYNPSKPGGELLQYHKGKRSKGRSLTKGSLKNNLTFWHLIFRSFSVDFKEQKP